jgi:serine/threonine-protein kinase RsbW
MRKAIKIKSNIENLRIVEKAIDEISTELGLAQEAYGKIMVSALEAVNNAVMHGNGNNEEKVVKIVIIVKNREMTVSVEDEGEGFIPEKIPDPTHPENIENLRGRGVFLMSRLADEIKFNSKGNRVIMTFKDIET